MIVKVENNQPANVLRIEYMLGNTCNQKCNYCFPGSNEGDQPWPDLELAKTNLSILLDYYKNTGKDTFNIFFVGGEPTLWDDFLELCTFLKSKYNCILEISTNGTRGMIWWTKAARVLDHINISMHHEYAKENKIKTLADFLYSAGAFVNVDVLMDPNHFEKCQQIVEFMETSTYNWPLIAKVVHYDGKHQYKADQLKYFDDPIKRYPEKNWYLETARKPRTEVTVTYEDGTTETTYGDSFITRNNLNYFKDWTCNLGVDHIKIFHDGRITGNCQQTLYRLDFDYNLYSKEFKFNPDIKPVICSKVICGCTGEIGIKKCLNPLNL